MKRKVKDHRGKMVTQVQILGEKRLKMGLNCEMVF